IFYTGPYHGDLIVGIYVAWMLAIWVGWVVALVVVVARPARPQERGLSPFLHVLDRGELAILAVLALWSLYPLAVLVRHAAKTGQLLTGADSPIPGDQLQYLSWIRDA